MSSSFTYTGTQAFTRVHAKRISFKVATDLKRMQRLYGLPTDREIEEYERELIELVTAGYLRTVTYGYRRSDSWIEPAVCYTAFELADPGFGDDPGRVRARADISGASFYSYLIYSSAWDALSGAEQDAFKESLPFRRGGAPEPGIDGYLQQDLAYSAGGRGLQRATVRSWG